MSTFARIRELEKQVAELKQELSTVIMERDKAREMAIAQCHNAIYAAEQGNRKRLICIKTET